MNHRHGENMTQKFDKLITEAAPAVPDAGRSRRVARALLHERMRGHQRRRLVRNRWGLSLAAGLAFWLVTGGQITQLGSDAFETESAQLSVGDNDTLRIMVSPVRGNVGNALPDMTTDEVRELQEVNILREGKIAGITAISFGDQPAWWRIDYVNVIGGKKVTNSRAPATLSVESQAPTRDKFSFVLHERLEFESQIDSGALPAEAFGLVVADGVTFDVRMWSREYAEWGKVTIYRGSPVSR